MQLKFIAPLISAILFIYAPVFSQEFEAEFETQPEFEPQTEIGLTLGIKTDDDGNSFWGIIEYIKPIYINYAKNISLNIGVQEDFKLQLERGFDGATGNTKTNTVNLFLGPQFFFLNSRKLSLKVGFCAGWGYKTTKGSVVNNKLGIHRTYEDSYSFLSRNILFQPGYRIGEKIKLSLAVQIDLRRLTNGNNFNEDPDVFLGIGVSKSL